MAAAASWTLILPAEPVHHVTGVAAVTAAQAEVGRAADGHVTDGALEGQLFADGTLRPPSLAAAVAAVNAKLWRGDRRWRDGWTARQRSCDCWGPTDPFVRLWSAGGELENIGSLVPQAPAVQDLAVTLLKVVKLQRVGGVQQPADRK